jgi:hypothetical protein
MHTWDLYATGVEVLAASSSYMALILDDTRRVPTGRESQLQSISYAITQGQGRARGTATGGLRAIRHWSTVLLTTGEDKLADRAGFARADKAGGAAARILSLTGSPFGVESAEMGDLARQVKRALLTHYGHLLPRIVRLLQEPGARERVVELYDRALADWTRRAGDSAVAQSGGDYMAQLEVAKDLMEAAGVPKPNVDPLELAWESVLSASRAADLEVHALAYVYEWAVAHPERFWDRAQLLDSQGHGDERRVPHQGWAGRWPKDWLDGPDHAHKPLSFLPSVLRTILREGGFVPDTIIEQWGVLGWLQGSGRRRTARQRLDGEVTVVYSIRADAFTRAGLVSMVEGE